MPSRYPNIEIEEEAQPPPLKPQEEIFDLNDDIEIVEPVVKKEKPKRKMTQKQLDHLTRIRKTAADNRKKKTDAKKKKSVVETEVGDSGIPLKEEEDAQEEDYNESFKTPKISVKTTSNGLTTAEIRKIAREEAKFEKQERKKEKQKLKAKSDELQKARQEGIAMGRKEITDSIGSYVSSSRPKQSATTPQAVPTKRTFNNPKLDALLNF